MDQEKNQKPRASILVIEDEEDILHLLAYNLKKANYTCLKAMSGEEGIEIAKEKLPDLILLDLMLPGASGLEVCQVLKKNPSTKKIPIIISSAKGEEGDVVKGLQTGADDYVTKPFSIKVMIARIDAVLRRRSFKSSPHPGIVKVHSLEINPKLRKVILHDQDISDQISKTEFAVLYHLASHPGWIFTRYQIIDAISEGEVVVTERSIDVQVASLRKKLGIDHSLIETVRGVGYRFKAN